MLQSGNNGKCLELAFLPLIIISIKTKNQRNWFLPPPPPLPPPPHGSWLCFPSSLACTFFTHQDR